MVSLTDGMPARSDEPSRAAPGGIELWNVADGVRTVVGAQERLNILGSVADAGKVERLTYRLNGSEERPVLFRASTSPAIPIRLSGVGDFSIDTVADRELATSNELRLTAYTRGGSRRTRRVEFPVARLARPGASARLELAGATHAQSVGQAVDGRWMLATDPTGRPCLRIAPADAGLDRVVLFTVPITEPAYTLTARLRVESWRRNLHNVGLVFAWRGHRIGDGRVLPPEWTTGLSYYYSHCPGLRLRVGDDVHLDDRGRKSGDRVLAERPLSKLRALVARGSQKVGSNRIVGQLPTGRDYQFRLRVTPQRYSLAVWPDGGREPRPQVEAETDGLVPLPGAAGIIAHYCSVNVYEFSFETDGGSGR